MIIHKLRCVCGPTLEQVEGKEKKARPGPEWPSKIISNKSPKAFFFCLPIVGKLERRKKGTQEKETCKSTYNYSFFLER